MITLLQPTYGANLPRLPESDPSMRLLEKTVKNRHAGLGKVTGGASVSTEALVESSNAVDPAYGLLTMQLTTAASEYQATAGLLAVLPGSAGEMASDAEREENIDFMS